MFFGRPFVSIYIIPQKNIYMCLSSLVLKLFCKTNKENK